MLKMLEKKREDRNNMECELAETLVYIWVLILRSKHRTIKKKLSIYLISTPWLLYYQLTRSSFWHLVFLDNDAIKTP